MNRRQLGRNGPFLTEIGLGAWAIGGPWEYGWGPTDDAESVRTIHRCIELGVNWIDTAAVYGLGHSEEVIARALKGKRDKLFIATKCAQVWDEKGGVRTHLAPDSMRREIEASLRRLQADTIDLYQIHWPDRNTPIEDSWGQMAAFQREGKVRYIGVSNFGVDLLERCRKIAHVQSLQPIYNMLERQVEVEILPYCKEHGIGVVAYSPLQSGLLSGSFDITRLARDDWRITHSEKFRVPKLSLGLALVEQLRPIAIRHEKTVGQLAVNWVLRNSAVTSAIVGARTVAHMEENMGATGWAIPAEEMQEIRRLLP